MSTTTDEVDRMTLDAQHWQDRLELLAAKHGVVGASLAVQSGSQEIAVATGVLNLRSGQPATADSVFQIGSITKVWTATLVMQLVDEGLLDLDAPVVTHLPAFTLTDADHAAAVTPRHLLSHTSGIDGDLFLDTGRGDDALERYVAAMADLAPVHPVGATMAYGNSGYSLLGRLVEVLRGATFDAVVRERLLAPLGLVAAGTLPEEALLWGAATGHLVLPGSEEPVVTPQWGIYRSAGPAGLIHMPTRDLLAFARLHLAGGVLADGTRLLSQESVTAMQKEQVALPDPYTLGSHWGLGWILYDWDGRRLFGHDGATLGQGAFLRVLPDGPDGPVAVALCCNGGKGVRELYEDLFGEVLSAVAGIGVPPRLEPTGAPVGDVDRFLGTYAREGVQMRVAPAGDGALQLEVRVTSPLAAGQPDPPPMELRLHHDDVLLARAPGEGPWSAVVFFDLDGERYLHYGARATRRVSA